MQTLSAQFPAEPPEEKPTGQTLSDYVLYRNLYPLSAAGCCTNSGPGKCDRVNCPTGCGI